MKKYGLTKQETDELNRTLSVVAAQERIMRALQESYRLFIIGTIFKRLSIKLELFRFSKVDLGSGELIIDEPKKDVRKSGNVQTKRQSE